MENFFKITDAKQLNKLFDNMQDKLVVIMTYAKNVPNCKRMLPYFERCASNHITSCFCVVDMDKFEGDSRYISTSNEMPRFQFYYQGNPIGDDVATNDKEIDNLVRIAEQYVMSQVCMRNNMSQNTGQNICFMPQSSQMPQMPHTPNMQQMPSMTSAQPINPLQIKQQILNNAQMQNPAQYQYLMQNQFALNQLVNNQVQMLQQQQMMNTQMPVGVMPTQMPVNGMSPQIPINMTQLNSPSIPPQQMQNEMNQTNIVPNMVNQQTNNNALNSMILPTFQQMQQMFQIFQMMQQMGILNINANTQNAVNSECNQQKDMASLENNDNIITLPNGDKLVDLNNGTYGLIKKS